jgi:hypothetical protein
MISPFYEKFYEWVINKIPILYVNDGINFDWKLTKNH